MDASTRLYIYIFFFYKLRNFVQNCNGPTIHIGREIQCLPYAVFFNLLSPFIVIFYQASHWPSYHIISSRPLIGQPSFLPSPFYPHWSRDSVFPVCGIFSLSLSFYQSLLALTRTNGILPACHIFTRSLVKYNYPIVDGKDGSVI